MTDNRKQNSIYLPFIGTVTFLLARLSDVRSVCLNFPPVHLFMTTYLVDLLCLPGHPRQRPTSGRPFRRQTSPRFHWNQVENTNAFIKKNQGFGSAFFLRIRFRAKIFIIYWFRSLPYCRGSGSSGSGQGKNMRIRETLKNIRFDCENYLPLLLHLHFTVSVCLLSVLTSSIPSVRKLQLASWAPIAPWSTVLLL